MVEIGGKQKIRKFDKKRKLNEIREKTYKFFGNKREIYIFGGGAKLGGICNMHHWLNWGMDAPV